MSNKTVTLERSELIWETRRNTWDESDYQNLLNWLETFQDSATVFGRNHYAEFLMFSQYTWDQMVDMIKEIEDGLKGYRDFPMVEYEYEQEGKQHSYRSSLVECLIDYIREDNYDSEVSDTQYADDFDEEFLFSEEEDNSAQ